MSNLTVGMVFVSLVTAFMWLSQVAILDLNPDGSVFYNCSSATLLSSFDKNNCGGTLILDNDEVQSKLPAGEGAIEPSSNNIFTDSFASIKNWFIETTKLNYVYAILSAPYNLLKAMHLPNEFSFIIGTLWYCLNLFLIVAFFWGRDA